MEDELICTSLRWLNLYGLDPTRTVSIARKSWTYFIIIGLTITGILVAMTALQDYSLDTVADICNVFAPFTQSILKIITMLVNKKSFIKILKQLSKLSEKRSTQSYNETVYRKTGVALTVMRCTFISAVVLMALRAIYLAGGELPYVMYVPDDMDESWTIQHTFYFTLQTFFGLVLIVSICGFDSFYAAIITNIVAHTGMTNDLAARISAKSQIREVVERQTIIFDCTKQMESIYASLLLFEVVSNVFNICMGLYMIHVNGFARTSTVVQMVMVSSTFVQLFMYCFLGYQVAIKLDESSFAIYNSNWNDNMITIGKDINFMISRANRLQGLTIGGIMPLDMNTFTEVVKKSFSFYTLLLAQR